MRKNCRVPFVVLLISMVFASQASGQDWPTYRGVRQTGTASETGVFDREAFGLTMAWKRPLGSGYSAISVAGDVGVTMFTDGTDDLLTAFDIATGEEHWRYRIAEMYAGHTGSDDGPISTPMIHDGVVYGLGPRGQLFAVHLDDGSEVWSRVLGEDDSLAPTYGFTTAPLVAGDVLVVQTGGPDGHSVCAFDRATGEPRWSAADDPVSYQSPAVLELAGREQLVAINDKLLIGLDFATGEVLWKHEHGTAPDEAFTQPQSLGPNRLLINSLDEAAVYEVRPAGDGYAVEEIWRSSDFKRSYSIPVLHEGYLFGFNGRFLTSLDATTGEVAWKSRPPGGEGLILVDGHLVILDLKGELVVARASPVGYEERARLPVFDRYGLTAPSFAGGLLFVRNLTDMAAVRITEAAAPSAAAEIEERKLLGELADFVHKVEAADNKESLIEAFMASHDSFPIIEDDGLVHFIYRGEVEDIALSGNFLLMGEEVAMDRIAGTDFYFKSVLIAPELHWWYRFNVNFGNLTADPLNPHELSSFAGPASELRMPGWESPAHVEEPEGERGRLDSFEFHSDLRDGTRRVRVWLPPGYAASGDDRYPVLLVHHAEAMLGQAKLGNTLDNLVGNTVAPLIAVLLPSDPRELAGAEVEDYLPMLIEEFLPHLDKHYRTRTDPSSRALMGILDDAAFSVFAALESGSFGKVGFQSVVLAVPFVDELWSKIEAADGPKLEAYGAWGRHDIVAGDGRVDAARDGKRLLEALEAGGHTVTGGESAGTWGWGTWRAQFDDILESFFPMPETSEDSTDP